jgi:hypothetical protein
MFQPTALPCLVMQLLFCSCAWSIGIHEKYLGVLLYFESVFSKHSWYWVPLDAFQKVQSCVSNALESTWHNVCGSWQGIIWPILSGHQEHCEGCWSQNVYTRSTAIPLPTQLTSTGTRDFPLLSHGSILQNQDKLYYSHLPYSLRDMVIGSMLQDMMCTNSNLMRSPCIGDKERLQEDSAVPGVVILLIKGDHWYLSRYTRIRCQQHSSLCIWMTNHYHCVGT